MNVRKFSKQEIEKGKVSVSRSTDVSVLQGEVRCFAGTRPATWRSKCHNSCDGGSTCCTSDSSRRNHQFTSARKSELLKSRVTLPTRGGNDRGETSTQAVLIVPVVLSLLFVSAHLAVLSHASHIAQLAAQRGAQTAATADGSTEIMQLAQVQSQRTVADMGGHVVGLPRVISAPRIMGMTVELSVNGIVPFLPTHVTRTAWVSKEEFLMEQDR